MTEKQKQLSLATNKLSLSFWDKLSHFGIVVYLFLFPVLLAFFHLKDLVNGKPGSVKEGEIYFFIIPTTIGILFYKLQSEALKFKEVYTTLSRQELAHIIEQVGTELKWHPVRKSDSIFIAKTHPSFFSGSWGEQVTILFDKNRILVNSICDPDKKSSVVSMGRNKKNVTQLIEAIEAAIR